MKETGIQLWTLRDNIAIDLIGTIEALAKIGYTSIEAFGFDGSFYGQPAREFRTFCNNLGIAIHSTHTGITAENATEYSEKALEAGLEYLVLPSMMGRPEGTIDDFKRLTAEMNQIGESCNKKGIRFGYHNHGFEFKAKDGVIPYDILLKETDPALVSFQLDIYWIKKAGQDPLHYFKEHPGRFQTWHVKDMGNDGDSCIVGNGNIDFKKLMRHAKSAGLNRIFVEQEAYSEGSPLFCAGQSFKYIQSHLF
jgi:sugar phosphate isomerase/epimerase